MLKQICFWQIANDDKLYLFISFSIYHWAKGVKVKLGKVGLSQSQNSYRPCYIKFRIMDTLCVQIQFYRQNSWIYSFISS